MVKVKITRDCSIKGKYYGVGAIAEVIEKYRDLLIAIEKAVAYVGLRIMIHMRQPSF